VTTAATPSARIAAPPPSEDATAPHPHPVSLRTTGAWQFLSSPQYPWQQSLLAVHANPVSEHPHVEGLSEPLLTHGIPEQQSLAWLQPVSVCPQQ
jgi:hypothetical protein